MINESVIESPCIRNCTLDKADVCVGCGRSLNEIKRWSLADKAEKELILERSNNRLSEFRSR